MRPHFTSVACDIPLDYDRQWAIGERLAAFAGFPLIVAERAVGVMAVFAHGPLSAASILAIESLAGSIALSIGRKRAEAEAFRLNEDLKARLQRMKLMYDSTIECWARALDFRDREAVGHSRRVTEMSLRLASAMGFGEADLEQFRCGALLHDIGKLGIADSIVHKPASLTDDEWGEMRRHPSYAVELLEPIGFTGPALEIPHYHHERWDGTGYPSGLAGEMIPMAARIFAAVDIWDALSHDRPYRRAWPPARVREHLSVLAGNHLDPKVVKVFLGLLSGAKAPISSA
jgi:HD-GYP domain-containing protein (c-di-GMP phosphodiesterase class II)